MVGGFIKGLLAGGILGALFSGNYLMAPQKKKIANKGLKRKTKVLQAKANRLVKDVIKDVNDLLK